MKKVNKIDYGQFGFRKLGSIIDAITKILNGFGTREKITTIFFDYQESL